MKRAEVAVIGGGASGMAASIAAARGGALVTLFEHRESVGNKILITGNGKCNLTHSDMGACSFHTSDDREGKIESILRRFDTGRCLAFFGSLGIPVREKRGCFYPVSDTAESVRTALILEMKRLGVRVICGCADAVPGRDLSVKGKKYDAVILATGGKCAPNTGSDGSGYEMLESLGVKLTPIYPALTPLTVTEDLTSLKGVRAEARLTLTDEKGNVRETSEGELQPYEKGLSGICALDLSSEACRMKGRGERARIRVDLYPSYTKQDMLELLKDRAEIFPERNPAELLTGMFPKKLINHLVHPIDSRKDGYLSHLTDRIKESEFEISDDILNDFSRAQTVAGGVPLHAVDDDLMLKECRGIYVTGELLDADGICGGYNLHLAWATGYLAGQSAAEVCLD